MTLLDTHAWLWWIDDPSRLSETALRIIEEAKSRGTLAVSAISAWEAAMLVKRGRLETKLSVSDLVHHCEQLPFLEFVPLTPKVAVDAAHLEPFHADPADRFIVATAMSLGCKLVTKDERIQQFEPVESIW